MAAEWVLYLLIDPTTGPGSRPDGTVFFVGRRADVDAAGQVRGRALSEDEIARGVAVPAYEQDVLDRLDSLRKARIMALVEYVSDDADEAAGPGGSEQARLARVVAGALHPRALNRPLRLQRPAGVSSAAPAGWGEPVELPEDVRVAVSALRSAAETPTDDLVALAPDDLLSLVEVGGRRAFRKWLGEASEHDPLLLLLVTEGQRSVPDGTILGAWWATGLVGGGGGEQPSVLAGDEAGAVWRRFRGRVVGRDVPRV